MNRKTLLPVIMITAIISIKSRAQTDISFVKALQQ